jgi:hypothetical protein
VLIVFDVCLCENYFDLLYQVCCPDLASCIFVLEQAVSVRALQEMVNTTSPEQVDSIKMNIHVQIVYLSRLQIKEDKLHFEHYYTVMLFFFDIIIVKW